MVYFSTLCSVLLFVHSIAMTTLSFNIVAFYLIGKTSIFPSFPFSFIFLASDSLADLEVLKGWVGGGTESQF